MLGELVSFALGSGLGLGLWFFSLDRRRGREARMAAHSHRLWLDGVHGAYIRALRYGNMEDLILIIKKAHAPEERSDKVLREDQTINLAEEVEVDLR